MSALEYEQVSPKDVSETELRTMMRDKILDARRFDSLAATARDPGRDKQIPVSESDAPAFRKTAFKARAFARDIYRTLNNENQQRASR